MTEDYNPKRKEVSVDLVESVKQVGLSSLKTTAALNLLPYVLPTAKKFFKSKALISSEIAEYGMGAIAGIALGAAQIAGYSYMVEKGNSEILLIPIATNIASGIYEAGRGIYNNAKQKLLKRNLLEKRTLERKYLFEKRTLERNTLEKELGRNINFEELLEIYKLEIETEEIEKGKLGRELGIALRRDLEPREAIELEARRYPENANKLRSSIYYVLG